MEWVRKASFAEILESKIGSNHLDYYMNEAPTYTIPLEIPTIKTAGINPYKVAPIPLEKRIDGYMSKWSPAARAAWKALTERWSYYYEDPPLPWKWRQVFKKMALKLHPDYNMDPFASKHFQSLYDAYLEIQKALTANAYT